MTSSKNVSRLRLPLNNDVTGGNPEFGLKSVRVSPPPLLSKTVLAGFLAHRCSVKRSLISDARMDWSEKVTREISKLLGLPAARYEFATGYFEESTEIFPPRIGSNRARTIRHRTAPIPSAECK
jgi:hypothetical protein